MLPAARPLADGRGGGIDHALRILNALYADLDADGVGPRRGPGLDAGLACANSGQWWVSLSIDRVTPTSRFPLTRGERGRVQCGDSRAASQGFHASYTNLKMPSAVKLPLAS